VAVVAPASALMRTTAGAASLVSIVAHVCFGRRESLAPGGPAGTNGVRLGQEGRPRSATRFDLPRESSGTRAWVCGKVGRACEDPRWIVAIRETGPARLSKNLPPYSFQETTMANPRKFTRILKLVVTNALCVGCFRFNHGG
jgi:hypothetical protein